MKNNLKQIQHLKAIKLFILTSTFNIIFLSNQAFSQVTANVYSLQNGFYSAELIHYNIYKLGSNNRQQEVGSGIFNMNTKERKQTDLIFSDIRYVFSNGNMIVNPRNKELPESIILDKELKRVELQPKYKTLDYFGDFIIGVIKEDSSIYLKSASLNIDSIYWFENYDVHPTKNYIALKLNGKWLIYDKQLNKITNNQYDYVKSSNYAALEKPNSLSISDSGFLVKSNIFYQIIDFRGNVRIDTMEIPFYEYEDILVSLPNNNSNRKVWNKNTKKVIYQAPKGYHIAYRDGMLKVIDTLTKKMGFMNSSGSMIIPTIFDYSGREFSYGIIEVELNGTTFNFDKQCRIYNKPTSIFSVWVSDSIYLTKNNYGKYGVSNRKNEILIPFKYDQINYEYINKEPSQVILGDLCGYIRPDYTKEIASPKYFAYTEFIKGYAFVETADAKFIINNEGQIVYTFGKNEFLEHTSGESKFSLLDYLRKNKN